MRLLLTLILVASVGFAAYWAVAAQVITRYGPDVLAGAPYIQARTGAVTGFPLAFRTELEGPVWQDAQGSFRWQTERLEIQSPSYQPNHIHLAFPAPQMVDIPGFRLEMTPVRQTMTAVLRPDMTLMEGQIEIEGMQVTPPVLVAGLELLHGTVLQGDAGQYGATLEITDVGLSDALRQQIDPAQSWPASIDNIALNSDLTFAAPITLGEASPDLQQVNLTSLRLDWGDLALTLSGEVQRSDSGLFDGQLSLHSNSWQGLHQLLGASGLLERDAMMMAGMFLASQADSDTGEIRLPLSVRQSAISLGPLTLSHLPGR